jgi:hypothetical protein
MVQHDRAGERSDKVKAIFCLGSSHIIAVANGYRQRLRAGRTGGFDAWKTIAMQPHHVGGKYVIGPAFDAEWAAAMSKVELSAIFLCFYGAEHAQMALVNAFPFDFYMPGDAQEEMTVRNGEVIPYDVMLATCAARVARAMTIVRHLKSLTSLPIYHILSPPPASDEHAQAYPSAAFRELLAKHGITPARVRRKLWRLCNVAARQMYEGMGISVIEAPSEALDECGNLAPQYCAQDPVHGNADYGALVIDRLVSIASSHELRTFP